MLRRFGVLGFGFLGLLSSVAYASGDFGCELPRGNLLFHGYENCNSLPFLSPSNDSRLNLELLLIDAGKLTGKSDPTQSVYYPGPTGSNSDFNSLRVPFDFDDWVIGEPGKVVAASGSGGGQDQSQANQNDSAQGAASRCDNAGDGKDAFTKAVNAAAGLAKDEAALLISERGSLVMNCDAATPGAAWKAPAGIHSAAGREFATYIAGASAFYGGDFATAVKDFTSLENSGNAWLKETSRYMVGRTLLNSAPKGAFGDWGQLDLTKVDKGDAKGAEDAFNAYLRAYPQGVYAMSARGLLRRVYWLEDDRTKLAEAFDRAFARSDKGANNVSIEELIVEADAKLMDSVTVDQIQSPQFLAVLDLMNMRAGDQPNPEARSKLFALADLEAQKVRFAKNPALYNYLLAVFHVYNDEKPDEALAVLPTAVSGPLNYFAFSQQAVRAMALEESKQFDAERKLLLTMLPLAKLPLQAETVQLEFARAEVTTGNADRVFAAGSPVKDQALRTLVIEYSASAEMLRQRIKDPKEKAAVMNAALYTLLYKELTGGKYKDFQADVGLEPAHPTELVAPFVVSGKSSGYPCPAYKTVAATLERDGGDARSLNCIGELVRNEGVHYGQDNVPVAGDLGGSDSLFPATNYSRMDSYLKVIAEQNAAADARAYALFRAVNCYAPSGYNDCGKQNIPAGTRKQWFETLHKEYPASVWAKESKYYW